MTSLDDVELFFRFKANGTLVEFTTLADVYGVFVVSECSVGESLQIAAWEPWDSGSRLGLRVSTSLQWGFGVGTYSITQSVDDPSLRVRLYYRTPDGIDYFAGPVSPDDATIVISHVGSSTIQGTFFGVLKAEGYPDAIITDGEFVVRRDPELQQPCLT